MRKVGLIQTVEGFKGSTEIPENKGILPPDLLGVPEHNISSFQPARFVVHWLILQILDSPPPTTV